MTLEGRAIIVTGALGVLGRAVCAAAEGAGARVARLDQAESGEGGELTFLGLDLADEAAAQAAMRRIAGICGRIHGLVNVSGGFVWSPVSESPAKVWEEMFRINLATALGATRAALDFLKAAPAGASIVNVGANAAARAAAGMGPYAASKAAVARLTESLAEELAADGVRVNAVLPSIIDTPTNRRDMPKADFASWVQPEDIAQVVIFLLSDAAAAVTGAAIPVTRGRAG